MVGSPVAVLVLPDAWRRPDVTGRRHRQAPCLAERTGQPLERIEKDSDRDNYMSASQGVEYGLIDRVLDHRS